METLINAVVTAALVLAGILYEVAVFIFGITVADNRRDLLHLREPGEHHAERLPETEEQRIQTA